MSSILKGTKVLKDQKSNLITPSGQKYWLEDADWQLFTLGHVHECGQGNNNLYLIEQKTEIFNLFFDFDFSEMNAENLHIETRLILFIQDTMQETIEQFFDIPNVKIVTSKNLKNNNLHFNLPEIQVRNETGMNIRAKLVEKLFQEIPGEWQEIIDAAVLKSSNTGLRILGCPKLAKITHEKLDNGYRVIEIENGEIIIQDVITVQHLQDTLIRFNGKKETPVKFVEVFKIDIPRTVDPTELEKISSFITHPHRFSKKINNFTFIYFNQGPRECMVREGYTHQNNHFYVKKNMNNEYYYHCHHEDCKILKPKFLFKDIVEGDFIKSKMLAIAEENSGKTKQEVSSNFLSYLNNYFCYILKQDCFMETRDGQLFWYKSLSNRLNFNVFATILVKDKKGEDVLKDEILQPEEIFKRSAHRREYNNVVFEPYLQENINTKKNYNLFDGFKQVYEPEFVVDYSKIEIIMHHFKHVWCKNNIVLYEFLMGWYSDMIQKPGILPGIAVVVKGEQGSGKGLLANFIGNIVIGRKYYSSVNEIQQLLGKHNGKIMNKILILCDEVANFGGAIANNNKLKGLITEPYQSIELKFQEPMDIKSCSRYLFLTNNEWPVKVETKCRRYACLETDSKYIGNGEYFKNLANTFTDENAKHLFHWFAQRDNSKWDKFDIPMTKFRKELMRKSLPSTIQYILHLSETKALKNGSQSIYEFFENYCNWFSTVQKTEHKKETLLEFVTTICSILDVPLTTTEDDFKNTTDLFKYEGFIGNTFDFDNHSGWIEKIKITYGYKDDIGV